MKTSFLPTLLSYGSAALLAFAPVAQAGVDAWHMDYSWTLVRESLDPIVSPNGVASHMHRVIGGSNFGAAYNHETYESSSCSSVAIQADKSAYWMPQLYFIDRRQTQLQYIPVDTNIRFYYFLPRDDDNKPVAPFPEGLRMLVGNPNSKSADTTGRFQFSCQTQQSFANTIYGNNFNFDHICPYGVKTEVKFPNCWDGVNLYKADGSHMSYPYTWPESADIRNNACPLSHPIRIPSILLEYTHHVAKASAGAVVKGNLAWANGDTTGYGIHADFVNGWDINVLSKALNSTACTGLPAAIGMTECADLKPYVNMAAAQACKPALGVMQTPCTTNDNADYVPLTSLPGCNPLWESGSKPTCSSTQIPDVTPFKGTDGPLTVPVAQQRGFKWPTALGWQKIGCLRDDDKFPAFNAHSSFTDPNMTVEKCQTSCARGGYDIAGLEQRGGNVCRCIKKADIRMDAGLAFANCDTPCPGNTSQLECGGSYIMNTYYMTPGTPNNMTTQYYKGCYAPTDNAAAINAATTYKFDSATMTRDVCKEACVGKGAKWMALKYGRTCMCGTNFSFGTGSYVPDSQCNSACLGDSKTTCGSLYQFSIFNLTNTDIAPSDNNKPAGYQGCHARGAGALALNGNSWKPVEPLTVDDCVNGCSELNFTLAGLDGGNQCSCGNSFAGGQDLPDSQCPLPCPGNANQTCGGSNGINELYNTTFAKVTFATQAAAHPAGWQGCYADSNSIPALSNYYYVSGAMSVATCKAACAGFSYAYAGVTSGNGCRCGTTKPTTRQMPAAWCSTSCAGNSSESCGSSGYLEAFDLSSVVRSNYSATLPGGVIGCFQETSNGNGLPDFSFTNTAMTQERCAEGCKELGYKLAGLENANKCDCGNTWQGGQMLPISSCNTPCSGNSTQMCGSTNSITLLNTTNTVVTNNRASGWLGCYMDQTSPRLLPDYSYSASTMNTTICKQACQVRGFPYAGTQSGNQCWCASEFTQSQNLMPSSQCATPCAGDASQTCGGNWRMDVYNATGVRAPTNGVQGYLGCYSDFYNTVNSFTFQSNIMSSDICKKQCKYRGFKIAAIDSGKTCRCGNTQPVTLVGLTGCTTPCVGTTTNETCGSSSAASTYSTDAITTNAINENLAGAGGYVGCTTDGKLARALTKNFRWNPPTNTNSKQTCLAGCAQLGYPMAAMSNGIECTCGTLPDWNNGVIYTIDTDCNRPCPGNSSETCGGGGRNSIFSIATSGIAAASTKAVGYKGCYLTGNFTQSPGYSTGRDDAMTADRCQRTCRNKGFSTAGLNNGNACYCSNTPNMGQVYPFSACYSACGGDSTQTCGGGGNFISIYDTQVSAGLPPSGFPTGYVGCFADPSNAKQMTGYRLLTATTMSASICGEMCKTRGFKLAGTENGNQCYCGNALPTTLLADSSCSYQCSGTSSQTCGGLDKLSVYNVSSVQVAASSSASGTASATRVSSIATASGTTRPATSVASGTTKPATSAITATATASTRASSAATAATTLRTTVASGTTAIRTATGSSTRAPLATGNFIVVDGSTCEADDIGTSSNVQPEARSDDVDSSLFAKRRARHEPRFKKVYRHERSSTQSPRRRHVRA